jgi:hypothetical protein
MLNCLISHFIGIYMGIGFCGLEVAGSNPAEAVGFLRAKKSSARLPWEGK